MRNIDEPLGEIATEVLFENDRVKIWNLTVEPGEASDWHLHERDYVTVVVEAGGLTAEYADGTTEVNEYEVGAGGTATSTRSTGSSTTLTDDTRTFSSS